MLRTFAISVAAVCVLVSQAAVAGQGSYSHGVFVGTSHGPIELTAYAEVATNGRLRMAKGSRENIPTLSEVLRVLCNLPNWQPGAIMIASQDIFIDEKAERRELRFAVRRGIGLYTPKLYGATVADALSVDDSTVELYGALVVVF